MYGQPFQYIGLGKYNDNAFNKHSPSRIKQADIPNL